MTGRLLEAWRAVWRRVRHARFVLFQKRRHGRLVVERAGDTPILVLPQVLNPVLFGTGQFLAEALDATLIAPGAAVLDMGTGSGIGAVFAARWAGRVVAVDINPYAVRCARINALLNGVEDRVRVMDGDLFEPVRGERYDIVLFNPPFYRGAPKNVLEQALYATDVVERFAAGLVDHLTPAGFALLVFSTDGDETGCLEALRARGFDARAVARRNLISEALTLYRVTPTTPRPAAP
jgi:release factor glutamine methyltransferase